MAVDQEKARADFFQVGLELLEEIRYVKDSVKSRCVRCDEQVGQSYQTVKTRIKRDTGLKGCRKCCRRLDDREALEVMKAAGLEPLEGYPGALPPWKFRCYHCQQVSRRRFADLQMGKGCPICGKRNRRDPRWISEEQATADFRAANLEPLEPYPGVAQVKWRATCGTCGNEVRVALREIRAGQGGCISCGIESRVGKRRRPQQEVAELFLTKGLELLGEYEKNRKPVHAECLECRKDFFLLVNTVEKGLGCPFCNQRRVDPADAIEIMRGFDLEPLAEYPGNPHKKWACRCNRCNNTVYPVFAHARHGRGLCPHCSGNIVDVSAAVELMRTRGLEPLEEFPGSAKPWLCRCERCGKETSPRYNSIYSKEKGGCKWCADKGIDYFVPSLVYLITNSDLGAHKIGIAAKTSRRLESHRREGWKLWKKLDTQDGYTAKKIEDATLSWWRETLGLAHYLLPEQMPQGGFSETVDASEVTLSETWDFVVSKSKALA